MGGDRQDGSGSTVYFLKCIIHIKCQFYLIVSFYIMCILGDNSKEK